MKRIIFLAIYCFIVFNCKSQVISAPLEAKGNLPDYLRLPYDSLYELKNVDNNSNFELSSELFSLLNQGSILFGDTLSLYLSGIVKKITLKSEIPKEFEVYLYKSDEYNAFVTSDGVICVSLGLLANADSEDEVAFVLSHELSHYILRHMASKMETIEKIAKKEGSDALTSSEGYKKHESIANLVLEYSREQELQADSLGLVLYLNAGYHFDKVIESMYKLDYDLIPYLGLPVYLDEYLDSTIIISDKSKLDSKRSNNVYTSDKGSYEINPLLEKANSTHPDVQQRISNLVDQKSSYDSILSSSIVDYLGLKTTAMNELFFVQCSQSKYVNALFNYMQLSKFKGDGLILKDRTLAMLLYNIYFNASENKDLAINLFETQKLRLEADSIYKKFLTDLSEKYKDELLLVACSHLIECYVPERLDTLLETPIQNLCREFKIFFGIDASSTIVSNEDTSNIYNGIYCNKSVPFKNTYRYFIKKKQTEGTNAEPTIYSFTFRFKRNFASVKDVRNQKNHSFYLLSPEITYVCRSKTRTYRKTSLSIAFEKKMLAIWNEGISKAKINISNTNQLRTSETYTTNSFIRYVVSEKGASASSWNIPISRFYINSLDSNISHVISSRYYVMNFNQLENEVPSYAFLSPEIDPYKIMHHGLVELILIYNLKTNDFQYLQFEQYKRRPNTNNLRSILYKTFYDIKNNTK